MDPIALLAAAALPLGIAAVTTVHALVKRARATPPHDDRLRVGSEPEISAGDAYRRASGKSAWMTPGGGGL